LKALIEIVVEPKKLEAVCKKLINIKEATKVYEITGEFDVFVELEIDSMDMLRRILKDRILSIDGVKTTHSSIVLGEWKSL
jgi:DNA-binding Lrp family transcriptional regulator